MLEIFALEIKGKIIYSKFETLLSFVSPQKQKMIFNYLKWEDAYRTLFADILVRNIISEKLNLEYKEISFKYNKYGKPSMSTNKGLHFNISHAGKWIVCGIDKCPVGIDIEKIRSIDFEIANYCFSKEEATKLFKEHGSKKLLYFYSLWTLKESYIKAIGKGFSTPLNHFTIEANNNIIHLKNNTNFIFKQYNLDKNYVLSVCATTKAFCKDIEIVHFDNLYKQVLLKSKRQLNPKK